MGCASGPGALRRAIQRGVTPGLRGGHCSRASLSDIPDGAPLSFIRLFDSLAALGGDATAATPAHFDDLLYSDRCLRAVWDGREGLAAL